jgi:hypothetical protein
MKIGANNKILYTGGLSVTSDADAGQVIADITTADFSTSYTSDGANAAFVISKSFFSGQSISYVAIAGHNLSTIGASFSVKVNTVLKGVTAYGGFVIGGQANNNQWVTMIHFPEVAAATNVEITIQKASTSKATLSYLAMGDLLDSEFVYPLQNTAPGGFPKNWRTRSSNLRSVVNDAGQPVANIRQSMARKTTLSLKNIGVATINSDLWSDFLELIYDQDGAFFYKEDDGEANTTDAPLGATLAFEADVMPPKLHGSTRALVDLSIKFNAYTGT